MFLFSPRYIKHGRQFIKDARKLIAYKRDLVSRETITDVEREIAHLEHAVAGKNQGEVEKQMERLNSACEKLTRPSPHAYMRENVEVFLVAIVIALAVRTYFLQPFTIPTGSMQPTLNGILPHAVQGPLPNAAVQAFQFLAFGRNYVDLVAQADEAVTHEAQISEVNLGGFKRFMTYSKVTTSAGNTYLVHAGPETVKKMVEFGRLYHAGEPIFHGYVETGDHVFVDKISYNFVTPTRGDVFVFSTAEIPLLTNPGMPSQYYIKRLAGLPKDLLNIKAPQLFVNHHLATEPGFVRVMSGDPRDTHGYRGYSNLGSMNHLRSPEEEFQLPEKEYFALGDNSYNSSDSRNWGTVPQRNIMGRAMFVYWPFLSHWGRIN